MIQVHITIDVSNSVYNGLTQPPNNLSCKLDVDVEVPVEYFQAWKDTIKELKSKKIPSVAWASGTHYLNSVDFYRFRKDQAELEKRIKEAYKRNLGEGVIRIRVNLDRTLGTWVKSTYSLPLTDKEKANARKLKQGEISKVAKLAGTTTGIVGQAREKTLSENFRDNIEKVTNTAGVAITLIVLYLITNKG